MKTTTRLNSFAKLNLSLLVYKPLKNNYHPLRSIFQTINLHDTLSITPQSQKKLTITSNNPNVPHDEKNILHKVYANTIGLENGFQIHIQKDIPMGGGLGGGSTNAAAFITYLKKFYPHTIKNLTDKKISLNIGADVPYFLYGKTALVGGIGEKITPIPQRITTNFLLILPHIHCDTKTIYQCYDTQIHTLKKSGKTPIWMLKNHIGHNDLKAVVFSLNPELQQLETLLSEQNVPLYMSGSGSTLFIPLNDPSFEEKTRHILNTYYPHFSIHTISPIASEAITFIK